MLSAEAGGWSPGVLAPGKHGQQPLCAMPLRAHATLAIGESRPSAFTSSLQTSLHTARRRGVESVRRSTALACARPAGEGGRESAPAVWRDETEAALAT